MVGDSCEGLIEPCSEIEAFAPLKYGDTAPTAWFAIDTAALVKNGKGGVNGGAEFCFLADCQQSIRLKCAVQYENRTSGAIVDHQHTANFVGFGPIKISQQ